jgi:hypothetical protein
MPIYTGKRGRPRLTDAEKEARGWWQDDEFHWHPPGEKVPDWITSHYHVLVFTHTQAIMELCARQLGYMGKLDSQKLRWSEQSRFAISRFLNTFFADLNLARDVLGTLLYFKRDVRLGNYPKWSSWRKRQFEVEALATLADQEHRSPDPFPGLGYGPHEQPCDHCGGSGRVTRVRVSPPPPGDQPCEVRHPDQPPGLLGTIQAGDPGQPRPQQLPEDPARVHGAGAQG